MCFWRKIAAKSPQKSHADIQDLTSYQNLTFNDSCFRLRPNGDGRGNSVIVI